MKETGNQTGCCETNWDYTLAFWVLRAWLGIRALMTGVEKFGAYKTVQVPMVDPTTGLPDPNLVTDVKLKFYAAANYAGIPSSLKAKFANEALLPKFALTAFDQVLGPLLLATGIMLLLGLGTRISLFLQGLLYAGLTVGLILIKQDDGVAWLGIHAALVAFALVLVKHNKLTIFKKW